MTLTYPPAPVQVNGDVKTIHQFLKEPTSISKYVQTLADQALIADTLLTKPYTTESGSFVVEEPTEAGTTSDPEEIAPGGEYPLTDVKSGDSHAIETMKRGFDAVITDESVSRRKFSPVAEAFAAMIYSMTLTIDSLALSAVNSAVTRSANAIAPWGATGSNPLRDLLLARATVSGLKKGLNLDMAVIDLETAAMLASDEKIAALLARESKDAPVYTGLLGNLGNFRIFTSEHLPVGSGNALLVDSTRLGGMGEENLYAPGYTKAQGSKIEVKTMRNDDTDATRVRVRRVTVPIIEDPDAGFIIEGVTS
ncbi:major capsid protein [Gordonia phage Finkle]|uniref:Major capsid protein n=1 Tax=Gordonia phage Finkle TaxID=2926099 RepID=A0A9E7NK49_9CAUD|nr:major capsid protein [Gordonia phage Finkle]UTN92925.1 major capsid protein [Gordonia phage Finkle]